MRVINLQLINGSWRVGDQALSEWEQICLESATMTVLSRWVLLVDDEGHGTVARVVGAVFRTLDMGADEEERTSGETLYTMVAASQVESMHLELVDG